MDRWRRFCRQVRLIISRALFQGGVIPAFFIVALCYADSKDELLPHIGIAKQKLIAFDKVIKTTLRIFSDLTDFEIQAIAIGGKNAKGVLSFLDAVLSVESESAGAVQ